MRRLCLVLATTLFATPLLAQSDTSSAPRLSLPAAGVKVRLHVLLGYGRNRVERREGIVIGYRADTMLVRLDKDADGDVAIPPAWFSAIEVGAGRQSAAAAGALLGALGGVLATAAAGAVLTSSAWFELEPGQTAEIAAAAAGMGAIEGAAIGARKRATRWAPLMPGAGRALSFPIFLRTSAGEWELREP